MRTVRSRRAFSMIEILVALAFLSFGIYAVEDLLSSSRHMANMSDDKIRLSSLGRQKLVEIEGAGANLAAFLANAEPGQELPYPADGPKAFANQPGYEWKAYLKREGESAIVRVVVTRTGVAGSSGQTMGQVHIGKEANQ